MEVWHVIGEVEEQVHRSQHNSTVAVLQTLVQNILKVNRETLLLLYLYNNSTLFASGTNGYFVNHNNSQQELSKNSSFIKSLTDQHVKDLIL